MQHKTQNQQNRKEVGKEDQCRIYKSCILYELGQKVQNRKDDAAQASTVPPQNSDTKTSVLALGMFRALKKLKIQT